jgi:hypothetical protein
VPSSKTGPSVTAWVRNIEDETHVSGGRSTEDSEIAITEPRLYEVALRRKFGARFRPPPNRF